VGNETKLPFSLLTKVYEVVGQTKGENSKNIQKNHLSAMFKELIRRSTDDLVRGYWLSIIKSGPEYERNELFIGKEILVKSVARSCGMSEKQVRDQVNKLGDLGEVAQNSKASQKTMDSFFTKKKEKVPLSIEKVFNSFIRISKTKGNNSHAEKENILINLLLEATNEESKFIIRWIEGNLKISAGEKTMQKALIHALFEELFPRNQQHEDNFEAY
jgi:DNA ligase 1